ncbi:hypothetical protein [uncultured Mediterranean phage]|nr:hypothetical protein [uncultured Mediterranean phage]
MNNLCKKIWCSFKGLLVWPHESLSHNIHCEKIVNKSPFVTSIFCFIENIYFRSTRLFSQLIQKRLLRLTALVSMTTLFFLVLYSAFVLACAVDDSCAAIHMGA